VLIFFDSCIDSGCNLVNRRLENDLSKILQRAQRSGIEAMIVLSTDYEKQEQV
jgi:Tat protein secretion system quality control protein TatD with DNase activity